MTYAVPKTKEADLLHQLEALFRQDSPPNEFAVAGLRREVSKLMPIDAAAGHTVLAGVAALLWDFDGVRNHCRQALAFDNSAPVMQNAAINLRNAALMSEAANTMLDAAKSDRLNLVAQREAVDFLYMVGRLDDAKSVMKDNLERGVPIGIEDGFNPSRALEALEAVKVQEEQLIAELRAVYAVLAEMKIRPRGYGFAMEESPDGGLTLACTITINGDFRDEIRVETELADRLAELPSWNPSSLSMRIEGVEEHADNAA
jgi:hypothetical protein